MKDRKIAVWGTGNIAQSIMRYYKEFKPVIFIDNYPQDKMLYGIEVLRPEEVKDYKEYFFIIAVMRSQQIEKQLDGYGLERGRDYCNYREYFNFSNKDVDELIYYVKRFINNNPEYEGASIYGGHMLTGRDSAVLVKFFSEYVKNKENAIFLAHTSVVNEEKAANLLGAPFFELPYNWLMKKKEKVSDDVLKMGLTVEEIGYCEEIVGLYAGIDYDLEFVTNLVIMKFYKELIKLIKPRYILVGTDTKPESRILKFLSDKNRISARFWEYGWIPGTISIEVNGCAGRSKLATDKEYYEKLSNKYSPSDIDRIKNYILSERLDTQTFYCNEKDLNELKKIDPTAKTIFLVGTGLGVETKTDTEFSKKYITQYYSTEEEIVRAVKTVCIRQGFNFIYKPHPELTTFDYVKDLSEENIIQIQSMSVDELIAMSDVVVSVGSAVDCKALIYDKPLVQLGHSILDNAKCTYRLDYNNNLENCIHLAVDNGLTYEQKRNFNELLGKVLTNCAWDDLRPKELQYGRTIIEDFFS